MAIPISIRAGLILTNDKDEYLVVKDMRSNKWSFPKGGKEDYDKYLCETAEREMFEETGFIVGRDYTYDIHNHVSCVVQTKKYISLYYFFVGKCIKNDLYFTQKLDEHIEDIKFVSPHELMRLDLNYVTKRGFLKTAIKI
jgi:8-oxo-dGTP pyrophosphatase MutT (NUDIX family)